MTEEKKPRGRLVTRRTRQRRLRELLLSHYEANPHFMTALRAVMARHRRFLSAEERFSFEDGVNGYHYGQCREIFEKAKASQNMWMSEQAIRWAEAILRRQEILKEPYRRHRSRSGPYERRLKELADTWGLRCDWAVPLLRRQLLYFVAVPQQGLRLFDLGDLQKTAEGSIAEADYSPWFTPDLRDFVDPPGGYIRIAFAYTPDTFEWNAGKKRFVRVEWKEVERRILQEAGRQRDEIDRQLERARGYVRKDVEPQLKRDVRWLYERIALGLTPDCKTKALAKGEGSPEDLKAYAESKAIEGGFESTYRDAYSRRAQELGIRLRLGRPPEARKRRV